MLACTAASAYHDYRWRGWIEGAFGQSTRYLMARDPDGVVRGVLPLARLKSALFGDFMVSLPYLNYGGPLADDAEVSIEVDPRVTGPEHVEALAECGFRRISLGVQDFDPKVQAAIHRVQPVEMTAELTERARRAGFRSVGYDLIYGLPFQTEASFESTLDTILALNENHVEARSLVAMSHLTNEGHAAARREAERALEVNPSSLTALTALAGSHLLVGDRTAFAEVRARALDINPSYAQLDVELAELSVQTRRYAQRQWRHLAKSVEKPRSVFCNTP